ncbi:hypothetical protein [Actinoplanes couchii]|uniref:Uncharacterized protein n=1 Tax=Actinoplanes couchii TaxID=403638 RepID=A0ABQ3XTW2_9ACTN|nr:hypothetical protein [Actinoplanes couchii]MDR6318929.1 hypothetical protein [Actinoplanes couchii]GID61837.1 hypothetical protein Aco03nite_102410 [Actinoplanes couchii]
MNDHFPYDPDGPPVPISVWRAPTAGAGETLSPPLAHRLLAALIRRRRIIFDLTTGEQIARTAAQFRCRYAAHTSTTLAAEPWRAHLIITGRPQPGISVGRLMAGCAARLLPGCPVAVVLSGADFLVIQTVIAAARTAGLTYRHHIVAAEQTPPAALLSIHTDVLVFTRNRR